MATVAMNEHYPHTTEELRRHFDFFDDDRNGIIDFDEYFDMLRILGPDVDAEEARTSFTGIDTNGDGQISFAEFVAWWRSAFPG